MICKRTQFFRRRRFLKGPKGAANFCCEHFPILQFLAFGYSSVYDRPLSSFISLKVQEQPSSCSLQPANRPCETLGHAF